MVRTVSHSTGWLPIGRISRSIRSASGTTPPTYWFATSLVPIARTQHPAYPCVVRDVTALSAFG